MRKFVWALFLMCVTGGAMAQPASKPDPDFYVYLCFGQSNMEGNARIEIRDLHGVDDRFLMMAAVDDPQRKR